MALVFKSEIGINFKEGVSIIGPFITMCLLSSESIYLLSVFIYWFMMSNLFIYEKTIYYGYRWIIWFSWMWLVSIFLFICGNGGNNIYYLYKIARWEFKIIRLHLEPQILYLF